MSRLVVIHHAHHPDEGVYRLVYATAEEVVRHVEVPNPRFDPSADEHRGNREIPNPEHDPTVPARLENPEHDLSIPRLVPNPQHDPDDPESQPVIPNPEWNENREVRSFPNPEFERKGPPAIDNPDFDPDFDPIVLQRTVWEPQASTVYSEPQEIVWDHEAEEFRGKGPEKIAEMQRQMVRDTLARQAELARAEREREAKVTMFEDSIGQEL